MMCILFVWILTAIYVNEGGVYVYACIQYGEYTRLVWYNHCILLATLFEQYSCV